MGELIVLTTPDLEAGYRLAGVTTRTVDSVSEAQETLSALLDAGSDDVVALHEPFFQTLDRALRRRIDTAVAPLVIALPDGLEPDVAAERRARLLRLLWEAVGYEITFEQEEGG